MSRPELLRPACGGIGPAFAGIGVGNRAVGEDGRRSRAVTMATYASSKEETFAEQSAALQLPRGTHVVPAASFVTP
jgi:hypothetical protein